jgi:YidC/Oxa1 family membrane protein insertase
LVWGCTNMNFLVSIGKLLKLIIYLPLLNLLVFVYHYVPDLGIVIIILTVLSRILLLPSFHKSLKHQKIVQALQPKINEIKEKYKGDKQGETQAMMELWKKHDFNPAAGCLPLLIQLPILISLYQVFIHILNGSAIVGLYKFVPNPGHISPYFLHFLDLSKSNVVLAITAGVLQYVQAKMIMPKTKIAADPAAQMSASLALYYLPFITVLLGVKIPLNLGSKIVHIGVGLPSGLVIYWIATTLFTIGQQYYILRKETVEVL